MTTSQTRYRVEGMDCASCASKITTAVRRVPGVADVSVSVTAGTMTVSHEGGDLDAAVLRQVNGLGGYRATPLQGKTPQNDNRGHEHDACCGGPNHALEGHGHDHAGHDHGHEHHHGHDSHAATEPTDLHRHDNGPSTGPWWRSRKTQLTAASGVALAVAYGVGKAVPTVASSAFVVAMLVGLLPIARRAFMAARFGTPFSIEMLMTIAVVGAVIIGAGEEGAAVVFLFLVGEMLEGVAADKARTSIQGLTALVPKNALLEENGQTREVPAEQLVVGSIIVVRPGDRIAADGVIVDGESAIDEAPVTGESVPKRKGRGATVFAGTINADGVLRVRVTAAAADNTIARVVRLVEEAQESKAPTERFIDRFSSYYTPVVVAVAALVAVVPPLLLGQSWGAWVYKGLAVLLIGCPCALVISTPAAIAAALSAGARRGLLIKGGAVLESLGTVQVIALDKTGTLTEGKPQVTDVVPLGRKEGDVLSLAAALETGSSHPLALAIQARAETAGVPVPPAADAGAIGGEGVVGRVGGLDVFLGSPAAAGKRAPLRAEERKLIEEMNDAGKSVSVLLVDGELAGIIAMRDEPRADARAGIEALRAAGVEPVMLTGDNRRTAEAVGASLGLPVRAELLPEDKQRIVRELQAGGRKVAKVGDGINDAPGLAAADVGIAMGGGTDVALETAGAAVLHGRVMDLARMVDLSRCTMSNIRQNIVIALGLKAVFLVTTIVGLTGLWPAILADTGATVLVTANAMRLLAWKGRPRQVSTL
jgi:Cd2+/Zn2+-exporting ATPase